jgi:hypothetical protein
MDVGKIRELMVKANEMVAAIRSRYVSKAVPDEVREFAGFSITLLDLVNAVVEGGILPMAAPASAYFVSAAAASTKPLHPVVSLGWSWVPPN